MATLKNLLREWKTFDEWKALGFMVMHGEKATWFDDVPKFSGYQVDTPLGAGEIECGWMDCSEADIY